MRPSAHSFDDAKARDRMATAEAFALRRLDPIACHLELEIMVGAPTM
jgi:hypothetical protein